MKVASLYASMEENMHQTRVSDNLILKHFKGVVLNYVMETTTKVQENVHSENRDTSWQLQLLKHGIVFDPDIFDLSDPLRLGYLVDDAIKIYGADADKLNSTFWKRFSDVESRSEEELRLHELLHYMTTYGRGIVGQEGSTPAGMYEPEYLKGVDFDVKHELTYISALTEDQLKAKIHDMLISGIALKSTTVQDLITIILDCEIKVDYIDDIKNREFMCVLCDKLGIVPNNFDEFVRYLNYVLTGSTMLLVKSKDTYINIKENIWGSSYYSEEAKAKTNKVDKALKAYDKANGIKKMGAGIRRYYDFFVLLHKYMPKGSKKIINVTFKLSKYKEIRKPRKQPALDHVMDTKVPLTAIEKSARRVPIFKLVKVLNFLRTASREEKLYHIRNGKNWLDLNPNSDFDFVRSYHVEEILMHTLKERLGDLSDKIYYIPDGIDYALPTSEKTFVGNLPYLSSFEFEGKDAAVGVAWDKECDLDLHAVFTNGVQVGWNSDFHNQGVVFSGDMTHTNQYGHAAEFFKLDHDKLQTPMIISIENYENGAGANIDVFATPIDKGNTLKADSSQGVATQLTEKSILIKDKMPDEKDGRGKQLMVVIPTEDGFQVIFTSLEFGMMRIPNIDTSRILTEILADQAGLAFSLSTLITLLGGHVITEKGTWSILQAAKKNNQYSSVDEEIKNEHHMLLDELLPKPSQKEAYTALSGFSKASQMELAKLSRKELVDFSPSVITASDFISLLTEPDKGAEKLDA